MDTLRITYSGRISAGRLKRTDYEQEKTPVPPDREYWSLVFSVHGFSEALRLRQTLGLSKLTNSHNTVPRATKGRRGLKGIGSKARVKVLDSAAYLEETVGRKCLSFLTLTLPQECLTEQLFQGWTEMTRKLHKWLRYQLSRAGLLPLVIGVVEIQERRQLSSEGMPGLHWHLLFQGRKPGSAWIVTKQRIQAYWNKLLLDTSGCEPLTSLSSRIERVRKSAYGYLGKYMSKGAKAVSQIKHEYLPRCWYMCTLDLRRIVKSKELYFTGEQARELYEYIIGNKRILRFSKLVNITTNDGRNIPVGWYGQLYDRFQYWQLYELAIEFRDSFERVPLIGISAH